MSILLDSLDSKQVDKAMLLLNKMREEYPAYPDHELLLYLLTQALTDKSERRPLP